MNVFKLTWRGWTLDPSAFQTFKRFKPLLD